MNYVVLAARTVEGDRVVVSFADESCNGLLHAAFLLKYLGACIDDDAFTGSTG